MYIHICRYSIQYNEFKNIIYVAGVADTTNAALCCDLQ